MRTDARGGAKTAALKLAQKVFLNFARLKNKTAYDRHWNEDRENNAARSWLLRVFTQPRACPDIRLPSCLATKEARCWVRGFVDGSFRLVGRDLRAEEPSAGD